MAKGVYRFHCLGGGDAVFDGTGRRMENLAQVRAEADRVALALMEMAETDWTAWIVDVRDVKGRQVLARPFTAARVDGRRAA